MRSSITLLSLLVTAGAALADATPAQRAPAQPASNAAARTPAINLVPIDLAEIPERCKTIAKQAGAPVLTTALAARISLASCLADAKLLALTGLCDCEDSMLAIDEAMKPSFTLLDEVVAATADDTQKIIATRAKAEMYTTMTTKMQATLPPPTGGESAVALHNARKGLLDGLLGRWRDDAAASYERIVAIVKANPKLEKNPVVASALRVAKDRLRTHVAMAQPAPQPQPAPGAGSKDERDAVIENVDEAAPKSDEETLR